MNEAKAFVESILDKYKTHIDLPLMGADGKYHYIYLIYHKISFKFYIGKHSTPSLEGDKYLGSGTHILRALEKHGSQSFTHVRLSFFATAEEAYKAEEELITPEVLKKYRDQLKVCYNLMAGGLGGSSYLSEETRAKMSQSAKEAQNRPEVKAKRSLALARPEVKAKWSQSAKEANSRPEVKAKISQAKKEALAIKELISVTGEKKQVHWKEMLPLLKEGWQLTSTEISIYNPSDNNRRTQVRFERKNRKVDKKKAYERLIKLLEDGWQVGYPPKEWEGLGTGSGTDGVGEEGTDGVEVEVKVEEARLEAFGELMAYVEGL